MDKIKVLWMNNGSSMSKPHIDNAKLEGIEIFTCSNMDECRRELSNHNQKKWEIILLDECPVMAANLLPNSHEIGRAYRQIPNSIPTFIVTCENKIDTIEEIVAKRIAERIVFTIYSTQKSHFIRKSKK